MLPRAQLPRETAALIDLRSAVEIPTTHFNQPEQVLSQHSRRQLEITMEFADVPNRPPPPPPLRMGLAERSKPYYMGLPDQAASPPSPPSPSDALMAASPTSPSLYTPGSDRKVRSLTDKQAQPRGIPPQPRPAASPEPSSSSSTMNEPYRDEVDETPAEEPEPESEDGDPPQLPPLIVVTGAASGLGLAFFEHFSAAAPAPGMNYDVLGIDKCPWRLPGKGFLWQSKVGRSGRYVQLDVTASAARLDRWAEAHLYAAVPGEGGNNTRRWPRPVSLLIHCAGARGLVPGVPGDAAGALEVMDAETMRRAYDVNVVGTLQLVQAVLPHLQLHAGWLRERQDEVTEAFGGSTEWLDQLRQQGSRASLQITRPLPPRDPPARIVVMGSSMGSVGANTAGGDYAYRASQAALNAVLKSLSIDVPEVCFANVNPGPVETGLVKGGEEDSISCDESLKELLPLIEKLGDGKLASGCFVDKFGDLIKW